MTPLNDIRRRMGHLVAGVLSLGLLAALVAGLPYLLWHLTGNPCPRHMSWSSLAQQLREQNVDDQTLLRVLADAAWVCWAIFTLQTLAQAPRIAAEALHYARSRPGISPAELFAMTPARRGPLGSLTRSLLLSAAIGLLTPRATLPTPAPLAALTAHTTTISTSATPPPTSRPVSMTSVETTCVNQSASTPSTQTSKPPATPPRLYIVEPGDTLWSIAHHQLGDGRLWHQLYLASAERPEPDGQHLHNPRYLRPGWTILLPTTDAPPPPTHPPRTPLTPPPATPAPTKSPTPDPAASTDPAAPVSTPLTRPAATPLRHGHGVRLPAGGWLGMTCAAGIAAMAAAARLHQRRRARARWPIPTDQPPDRDDPAVTALVRAHTAASTPPGDGYGTDDEPDDPYSPAPHPPIRDGQPPKETPPTQRGAPPPVLAQPRLKQEAESGLGAPARPVELEGLYAPGGLILGEHPKHGPVTLLGDGLPGLGLTGPARAVEDTARALLTAALACGGAGATLEHISVLIPRPDLDRLLPDAPAVEIGRLPRLSTTSDLAHALDQVEAELLARRRILDTHDLDSIERLRREHPEDAPDPLVLIAIAPPDAARRLHTILHTSSRLEVHGLLLGGHPLTTASLDSTATITRADGLHAEQLPATRTYRLAPDEARALLHTIAEASPVHQPAPTDKPPQPGIALPGPGPAEDEDLDPADTANPATHIAQPVTSPKPNGEVLACAPITLHILGPVRLTTAGTEVTGGFRAMLRSLLVYLALHPSGVRREQVTEALWPNAPATRAPALLRNTLHQTRTALRTAAKMKAGGPDEFIASHAGRLTLNPAMIELDLRAFTQHLGEANRAEDTAGRLHHLAEATSLYHGPLAEDIDADWLTAEREAVRRQAVDALTMLARIHGETDGERALALLDQALAVDVLNEELYQRIMRAQARLGRPDAIRRTLTLLQTRLTELDVDPSPATLALAESLTKPLHPAATTT